MSHEILAMRKRDPRMAAAICTFSMTVREMACHCRGGKAEAMLRGKESGGRKEGKRKEISSLVDYCFFPPTAWWFSIPVCFAIQMGCFAHHQCAAVSGGEQPSTVMVRHILEMETSKNPASG